MACAYECIKHSLDIDLLGKVAAVAPVLEEEITKLVDAHPSVKIGRSFGMFGAVVRLIDANSKEALSPEVMKAVDKEMQGLKVVDNKYTTFGKLLEGEDVLDSCARRNTQAGDRGRHAR